MSFRYVLRVLRIWRNWYIFSNDYLNGLQSTFLAPPQSAEQISVHLKKLDGLLAEEIERKCRLNGLSQRGGIEEQKHRFARLEAYLHGTSAAQTSIQKKLKSSKSRKQTITTTAQKKEQSKQKTAEPKASGWVTVEQEQEKKPAVPISQWLQEKHQVTDRR